MQYVQYFDIIMIEWLASRISWLEMRHDDRKAHEIGMEKIFLCRRGWIVISSL